MAELSLIIPVYNEEKFLEQIVQKTLSSLKDVDLELILVDDCSTDRSLEIAQKLECNNIKVLHHKENQGKGAALKTGFMAASGKYIGIQDADDEYDPNDYLKLLKPLREDKADICFGSRYLQRKTRRVLSFWHTFMNKGLTLLTNMYTNLDITDMETCYKLFKKEVIQQIAPKLKENRFGFEPEVTIYVAQGNYRVYECAISYNPRTYAEGKKIGAKDGLRAIYCILHYGAYKAALPMQFILYIIIGALSALVNILAFMLLVKGFGLLLSIIAAFVISALVNYLLCIALLFRHKARWSSFGEIITYIITVIFMCALDYWVTDVLLLLGLGNFFSKSLSSLIGVFGNFALRKWFVFGKIKN